MKRAARILEKIFNIVAVDIIAWFTFAMMALVLVEVVARYFFNHPFGVADEVSAYMLVAMIFLGTAYTWRARGHIRVEALVSRLSPNSRKWLRLVTLVLATGFVPILIKGFFELWQYSDKFHVRTGHWLRIPVAWPQLAMLIGVILLFIMMLIDLIKTIRAIKSGEEIG